MKAPTRVSLMVTFVIGLSLVCGLSAVAQTFNLSSNMNLTSTNYAYQIQNFNVLRITAPTSGGTNLFVGKSAGTNAPVAANTFVGSFSGSNTTGSLNSFLGYQAGYNNTTGSYNTFIGYKAAGSAGTVGSPAGTGSANTFVGYQAGYSFTSGSGNVFLGYKAGFTHLTGDGNIYLGQQRIGPQDESWTTRIGGEGEQSATYIAGIYNMSTNSGAFVCIDSTGKLGTTGCDPALGAQQDLIRAQAQRIQELELRLSRLEALAKQ